MPCNLLHEQSETSRPLQEARINMTHPTFQDGLCLLLQRLGLEYYLTSRADTRSSGPVNASEIGQFFFDISTFS